MLSKPNAVTAAKEHREGDGGRTGYTIFPQTDTHSHIKVGKAVTN
jgi:hypothetical protein